MDKKLQIEILERLFDLKDMKTTDLASLPWSEPG